MVLLTAAQPYSGASIESGACNEPCPPAIPPLARAFLERLPSGPLPGKQLRRTDSGSGLGDWFGFALSSAFQHIVDSAKGQSVGRLTRTVHLLNSIVTCNTVPLFLNVHGRAFPWWITVSGWR